MYAAGWSCGCADGAGGRAASGRVVRRRCERTSNATGAPSGAPSEKGGDLVLPHRTGDLIASNPTAIADNLSIWAEEQIFETLYTVDNNGKGVHPYLATRFTLSPDKLTWTFTLRPGVKF